MADSFVIFPNDSANTGKRIRTNTRNVSGQTVHEYFMQIVDPVNDYKAQVVQVDPVIGDFGMIVYTIPSANFTQRVIVEKDYGGGTIATGQVAVDTTAGGTVIAAARATRRRIVIVNHGTTDVYIGVSGLTTSTGMLLIGIAGASVHLETAAAVYGIVGSGNQTVSFVEEY
jgi:hypothetical protein